MDLSENKDWIVKLVDNLMSGNFFGKITLQFEAGKVVSVRKEQVLIPAKDNPR